MKVIYQYILHSWARLAKAMGLLSGTVLLTAVYIIAVVPLAIVMRICGQAGMRKKPAGHSFYKVRDHRYVPADLENGW